MCKGYILAGANIVLGYDIMGFSGSATARKQNTYMKAHLVQWLAALPPTQVSHSKPQI